MRKKALTKADFEGCDYSNWFERAPAMHEGDIIIAKLTDEAVRKRLRTLPNYDDYLVIEKARLGICYIAFKSWPDFRCRPRGRPFTRQGGW